MSPATGSARRVDHGAAGELPQDRGGGREVVERDRHGQELADLTVKGDLVPLIVAQLDVVHAGQGGARRAARPPWSGGA